MGVKGAAQKLQMGILTDLHGAAVPYFRFAPRHPVCVRVYCSWVHWRLLIEWVVGWDVLVAVQACMRFRIGNRGVVWCMSESR